MPYTTAALVKKESGLKFSDFGTVFTDDTDFSNFMTNNVIPEMENVIDRYCNREGGFAQTALVNELYDGKHATPLEGTRFDVRVSVDDRLEVARKIWFRKTPVTSIQSIDKNSLTDGTGTWSAILAADYVLDEDTRAFVYFHRDVPKKGKNNIRISYTYGFVNVPTIVQYVGRVLTSKAMHQALKRKAGKVVTPAEVRAGFSASEDLLSPDLQKLLDAHVRMEVG